jgi:hypothetical protein
METKIKSWSDGRTGETCLVIYAPAGIVGGPGSNTVYNLFTRETKVMALGEVIPEEFIIKLPWNAAIGIKQAFAEWIYGEGIRPEDVIKKQGTVEGSLEATRYHLEDLRKLLKLPGPAYPAVADKKGD